MAEIKQQLLVELEEYFGSDKKRIGHAVEVLKYAEMLLGPEGAAARIVIPAAILHDVGIKVAEQKYGSSTGHYQEKEGPPVARKMLEKSGLNKADIDEICDIIAHHHSPGKINTANFRVLFDADWLVNLKDEIDISDGGNLRTAIDRLFLTRSGRELAVKVYCKGKGQNEKQ